MNLIFYFDQPILPHAGGTERAAYLLAQALSRHGHRVSFLSLRQADVPPGELPYFTLPRQDTLFCRENREYVENLCSAQKTDGLINCGANQDDSFFFSHEHLDIQASIISWISFDVRTGLDYFSCLLRKDFSTWGNTMKTLLRHALLPCKNMWPSVTRGGNTGICSADRTRWSFFPPGIRKTPSSWRAPGKGPAVRHSQPADL